MIIPDIEDSESLRQGVAQPTSKVVQPETETNVESRLSDLESKIEDLKIPVSKIKTHPACNQPKKSKIKRPSRDSNPSRSLDRATC